MQTMRGRTFILVGILLWAAALRLWRCDAFPRGLQIDEASNAWNAYCLLKTGLDEWGRRWPIFYTRAFDDYRSPLYLYLLMPFQAVGGMSVCTTRLPAGVGGVVTVLLVYYIGRRLFDSTTGLIAAGFVALAPWHIQHTRWGHEGTVTPLLFAAAVAAMLWAGVPCVDEPRRGRAWKGLLAGLVAGVACYGYATLRLVIPVTLIAIVLVVPRCWLRALREPASRRPLLAIGAGLVITIGPLAWTHLTDPLINRRATMTLAGRENDTAAGRALAALRRYPPHFSPAYLFRQGVTHPALAPPPGYGWLHWYALPLLLAGAAALVWRWRRSPSARVVIAMLLAYPAGDLLFGLKLEPHPLRSFGGVVPMSLIAAVGAVAMVRWMRAESFGPAARGGSTPAASGGAKWGAAAWLVAGAFCAWVLVSHALYLRVFFGPFNDDTAKYWQRHVDLMQACELIKPHVGEVDAVFCTRELMIYPYALTCVFLEHDPRRWFDEPREYVPGPVELGEALACARYGKVRFLYDPPRAMQELSAMAADDRRQRVILILRPSQRLPNHRPAAEIRKDDLVWLLVYDLEI
jgi:4-amino-4-deoxy-L-arabinose transferase-like glycosyltransferase